MEVSKRKAAAMLGTIGEEGITIFNGFYVKVEDLGYDVLATKFGRFFNRRRNKTILGCIFFEDETGRRGGAGAIHEKNKPALSLFSASWGIGEKTWKYILSPRV